MHIFEFISLSSYPALHPIILMLKNIAYSDFLTQIKAAPAKKAAPAQDVFKIRNLVIEVSIDTVRFSESAKSSKFIVSKHITLYSHLLKNILQIWYHLVAHWK